MTRLVSIATAVLAVVFAGCNGNGGGDGTSAGGAQNQPASGGQSTSGSQSSNWSGYVRVGSLGSFNRVSGSWTVPEVNCDDDDTASSTWTGIGGFMAFDVTLIQAGTEQDCNRGPNYYAWWEVIPAPQIIAGGGPLDTQSFEVEPGDRITVTIDGSSLILWNITIENSTAGWTFHQTVPYVSGGTSAEWIVERPVGFGATGVGIADLADFGRASFFDITAGGVNPSLRADERVEMIDDDGRTVANPSLPGGDGDSFDVCFGASGCS